MGGMVALDWATAYPDRVSCVIPVSTSARLSPQGIAFSEVERQAITRDPKWSHGSYTMDDPPGDGLAVARMIAHITYLSQESMQIKFGRRRQIDSQTTRFGDTFEIESYLHYQGDKFVERFDANSYIYLTKAMDFYDLAEGFDSLEEAVARIRCKSLFISFRSDWLFSPRETNELVEAMRQTGLEVEFHEIESAYGHDAFLVEYPKYAYLLERFLERVYRYYNK
jgi:homoserine O-acetyltransferase